MGVFLRDRLESERLKREAIEREKEQMEREKVELMARLYEYEETTKRTERGETNKNSFSSQSSDLFVGSEIIIKCV